MRSNSKVSRIVAGSCPSRSACAQRAKTDLSSSGSFPGMPMKSATNLAKATRSGCSSIGIWVLGTQYSTLGNSLPDVEITYLSCLVEERGLELVREFVNWLRSANFILYCVGFFRRSCWLRLQNPPCLKQNFLALAQIEDSTKSITKSRTSSYSAVDVLANIVFKNENF